MGTIFCPHPHPIPVTFDPIPIQTTWPVRFRGPKFSLWTLPTIAQVWVYGSLPLATRGKCDKSKTMNSASNGVSVSTLHCRPIWRQWMRWTNIMQSTRRRSISLVDWRRSHAVDHIQLLAVNVTAYHRAVTATHAPTLQTTWWTSIYRSMYGFSSPDNSPDNELGVSCLSADTCLQSRRPTTVNAVVRMQSSLSPFVSLYLLQRA